MKWTEEVTAEVKALFLGGLSCTLIGRRYGISRNAVIGKITRLGVTRKAATILTRESAKWDDDLDAKLKRLVKDGATRSSAAEALGFTYNQIVSRCRVLGLAVKDGRHFTLAPYPRTGTEASRRAQELGQRNAPARIQHEPPDPNITGLTCVQMPLRGACRWPLTGSGADMVMCGQRCGEATYCGPHRERAFSVQVMSPNRSQRNLERSVRRYA